MTEAPSVTTFVVGDRLPWPDDASASEAKGPFDAGAIHYSGSRQECSIRKISALGVTLRSELALKPGDEVAVELGTGQRAAGTIAWASRGDLGVCFNDRIDVLPLLNRELVSQPVDRRSMPRVEVRCAVHLKAGANLLPATMRNISARGLQIEGEGLPPCGTYVSVFVEGLNVPPGEVVWRRDNLAGIEVLEELSWASIIPWIRNAVRKGVN
jgi:hypothetical protein